MTVHLDIPGRGELRLEHLVLDVNGTLTQDGVLLPGVAARITELRQRLQVHLLSADTFGQLDAIAAELGVMAQRLRRGEPEAPQKAQFIQMLDVQRTVAIGNGANDADMLRDAALGIAVLGPEGLAVPALEAADVLVGTIEFGLELLAQPMRLIATLRR